MGAGQGGEATAPRRRIWVQQVAVETNRLKMRVDAARARGDLTEPQEMVAVGVDGFVERARAAAFRDDPIPGRLANWWRGTLVEAAYRNMHSARSAMLDLYTDAELRAEIPMVVARANATLHRDDPRRSTIAELNALPTARLRPRMRRLVGDSYEKLDLEHAQLRSFRNIVLLATAFLFVCVVVTLVFVARNPSWVPLCFDTGREKIIACPSRERVGAEPTAPDILVATAMGGLGGAFAAVLSIRNLKGTANPYDVPVALAVLKFPLGAMTAILGLVAIKGGFAPGLSNLDNQGQILAYALLFGFSQQALSRLLDKRAQDLLEGLPGGEANAPLPNSKAEVLPAAVPTADAGSTGVATGTEPPPVPGAGGPDATAAGEPVTGSPVPAGPEEEAPATGGSVPEKDRPVDEPDAATQQDQFDQLRDTGNARKDQSEDEEAELLEKEFGAPDAQGIYGPPAAGTTAPPAPAAGGPAAGGPAAGGPAAGGPAAGPGGPAGQEGQ
ncbi:hypothetical protein [Phycicoccus sp. 3266]|uniref:hypothetical protein n=1 Tax=Phycicoccus sp. 3266 TaxID=2817751 RepID=UPI002854D15A|nr:hypothetical protein [Phycicoccus sp. 3266]MDR6863844.1 hypothetical protein [Phycicoccus sp. 3266]